MVRSTVKVQALVLNMKHDVKTIWLIKDLDYNSWYDEQVMVWKTDAWGRGIEILMQARSHHLGPINHPYNAVMGSVTGHTGTSTGHWLLKAVRDLDGGCQYKQRPSPS